MHSLPSKSPALIVEGPGDVAAIPLLMRRMLHAENIFDTHPAPHPKTNVEIRKLRRAGELERYVEYAAKDGDGVIIALDCEDFCPVGIAKEFYSRIKVLNIEKRVATVLFRSEFESMFFTSIKLIAAAYPDLNWNKEKLNELKENEEIRDAKGMISNLMLSGRSYKPTRDQARFANVIDLEETHNYSRSFRHFKSALKWLTHDDIIEECIYPFF